ncbi:UNVERIFIED_CONTAM: Alpha-glucan water dikinase, chloroplastic [Sesamum angustifolium]|uniref:Alpha-glucan water dikinase, chloroplastic n=1 Tax=Sesamum angustifolium TaxID=2727405 RepID=A0AAW2M9S4_9LAMI
MIIGRAGPQAPIHKARDNSPVLYFAFVGVAHSEQRYDCRNMSNSIGNPLPASEFAFSNSIGASGLRIQKNKLLMGKQRAVSRWPQDVLAADASAEVKIMYFISLVVENLALSVDNNEDLLCCLKGWNLALSMLKNGNDHWALFAKSVLDRTRLALASKAGSYHQLMQPSAEYLGALLGVDQWAVSIFTEEMIRAGSAASLSSLLNRLDPVLRQTAHLGSWQVISPVEAIGYVVVVDELLSVQNKSYSKPTILVAKSVKGEEEIPDGAVAVLTPDMPDVLSHVSVRARNSKVCFATCFDYNILGEIQANEGKLLHLKPTSADVAYSMMNEDELATATDSKEVLAAPSVTLIRKQFSGRYAII